MGAEGGRRKCLSLSFPLPDGERAREVPDDTSGIGREEEDDASGWWCGLRVGVGRAWEGGYTKELVDDVGVASCDMNGTFSCNNPDSRL